MKVTLKCHELKTELPPKVEVESKKLKIERKMINLKAKMKS